MTPVKKKRIENKNGVLVLDIGNTQTTIGFFYKDEPSASWRLSTSKGRTPDEWRILLFNLFNIEGLQIDSVSGVIVSSVVPPCDSAISEMLKKLFPFPPLYVGPGIKTGIEIKYDNPSDVGADRIVNAIAAYSLYGGPSIVVDFGTATTFDLIGRKGQYMGGIIAPGHGISAEALFLRASKLPRVDITKPKSIIGKTTVSSIQSGLFWGYVGLTEGIILRMKSVEQGIKHVIATGGLARLIAGECKLIDIIDGDLTLKGLKILYDRNQKINP